MPEEQLERSILERKERDELQAIAAAMSLKPATRSKKSDIIELILDSAGAKNGTNGADHSSESTNSSESKSETRTAKSSRAAAKTADAEDDTDLGEDSTAEN